MIRKISIKRNAVAAVLFAVMLICFAAPQFITEAEAAGQLVVVVDVGHVVSDRGVDDGASAPDGTRESALNLPLAQKLVNVLISRGYKVYTTLPFVSGVPNLVEGTHVSLAQRVAASNEVRPNLFISVHHNSYGSSYNSASGALALYDSGQTDPFIKPYSVELAQTVISRVWELGYTKGNRSYGTLDVGASVLRYNIAPAMTLEAGFMTNSSDLARCKDPAKQQQVAEKVADGIDAFLTKYPKRLTEDTTPPTMSSLAFSVSSPTARPDFVMKAKNVKDDESGVKGVQFRVWLSGDSKTSKTIEGKDDGSGNYTATFKLSNFGGKPGTYKVDVYGTDNDNNKGKMGSGKIVIKDDTTPPKIGAVEFSEQSPTTKGSFTLRAKDVTDDAGIKTVKFRVNIKGVSGSKTYTAKAASAGIYEYKFSTADLGGADGEYVATAYAYDKRGNMSKKAASIKVSREPAVPPTMGEIVYTAGNPSSEQRFNIRATSVAEAETVKFRVWNVEAGSSSVKNYAASPDGSGNHEITFDTQDFGGLAGAYKLSVYGVDADGKSVLMGSGNFTVIAGETGSASIMGESKATVEQMINYFRANSSTYPSYYEESPRSTSLEQFAQIYYDVCQTEGVRAEVAWAQMCIETGFLHFGGNVSKEQFNFAGMGASGGSSGFSFADEYGHDANGIRHGVIGHVQHLKCYADTSSPVILREDGSPVDPRWSQSLRGRATTVAGLEGTWAMSSGYAAEMTAYINGILSSPMELQEYLAPPEAGVNIEEDPGYVIGIEEVVDEAQPQEPAQEPEISNPEPPAAGPVDEGVVIQPETEPVIEG